jgi:hypothetical protein
MVSCRVATDRFEGIFRTTLITVAYVCGWLVSWSSDAELGPQRSQRATVSILSGPAAATSSHSPTASAAASTGGLRYSTPPHADVTATPPTVYVTDASGSSVYVWPPSSPYPLATVPYAPSGGPSSYPVAAGAGGGGGYQLSPYGVAVHPYAAYNLPPPLPSAVDLSAGYALQAHPHARAHAKSHAPAPPAAVGAPPEHRQYFRSSGHAHRTAPVVPASVASHAAAHTRGPMGANIFVYNIPTAWGMHGRGVVGG